MDEIKKNSVEEENKPMEQSAEVEIETTKGFLAWVKSHKKQLIWAGVSITTIIGIILSIKNKDVLFELWQSLSEKVKKSPVSTTDIITTKQPCAHTADADITIRTYTHPTEAFNVSRHIRTLPEGKHHSAAKAAEAMSLGIELPPNQTIVGPYTKCAA